jgi:hypothetical protein
MARREIRQALDPAAARLIPLAKFIAEPLQRARPYYRSSAT